MSVSRWTKQNVNISNSGAECSERFLHWRPNRIARMRWFAWMGKGLKCAQVGFALNDMHFRLPQTVLSHWVNWWWACSRWLKLISAISWPMQAMRSAVAVDMLSLSEPAKTMPHGWMQQRSSRGSRGSSAWVHNQNIALKTNGSQRDETESSW